MSRKAKARISRKAKIRTRNAESSNDKKMCLREMIDAKPLTKTLMPEALTNQLYQGEAWVKPR